MSGKRLVRRNGAQAGFMSLATWKIAVCATENLTGRGRQEVEKFGLPGGFEEVQASYGDGQGETARPSAAGVDIEDAFVPAGVRFMRVTRDDDLEACDFGAEVELAEVVKDVDQDLFDADDFGGGQGFSPRFGVHIAADGHDRSDGFELIEDGGIPDVASVDNGF
jgi:hypothetical protein